MYHHHHAHETAATTAKRKTRNINNVISVCFRFDTRFANILQQCDCDKWHNQNVWACGVLMWELISSFKQTKKLWRAENIMSLCRVLFSKANVMIALKFCINRHETILSILNCCGAVCVLLFRHVNRVRLIV